MTPEQKFLENQGLVLLIARKLYKILRIDLEEAQAWGHLGLWQACNKEHAVWEAYARVRIAGAIKDGARLVYRRPRSDLPKAFKYPDLLEFIDDRYDTTMDFEWPDEAPSYSHLYEALNQLSSREEEILRRSFFKGERMKDIAQEYQISEARISQLRARALLKVKAYMEAKEVKL